MLTVPEIEDINEECALLSYMGELYIHAGYAEGKFIYAHVETDQRIAVRYEDLLAGPFGIQY